MKITLHSGNIESYESSHKVYEWFSGIYHGIICHVIFGHVFSCYLDMLRHHSGVNDLQMVVANFHNLNFYKKWFRMRIDDDRRKTYF